MPGHPRIIHARRPTFTLTWTQARDQLSGSITISGTPCLTGGTITGSIKGTAITFGVVQGAVEVNYAGSVTLDGLEMSGTYATSCGKAEGDWQAARK